MACPGPGAGESIGDDVRNSSARQHADAKPQQCRDQESGEGSERRLDSCIGPAAPCHSAASLGEAEKDQAYQDGTEEIGKRCRCPNFGDHKSREDENAGADNQVEDARSQGPRTDSPHQVNFYLFAKGCCGRAVLHDLRRDRELLFTITGAYSEGGRRVGSAPRPSPKGRRHIPVRGNK